MEAIAGVQPKGYRERQTRVRGAAAEQGLSALVAFSRGGGTHDRVADELWLTGLATCQPYVPDLSGHWRAAGHVLAAVPIDGPITAVVESEELRAAAVADEVVVAPDLIAAVAPVLANAVGRRDSARVGVLGSDAVPFAWWMALEELLRAPRPDAVLQAVDDLGMALR